MDNFTFYSPTYFSFGKDTETEVGAYVKKFGGTKVLLHYGGGSVVRSGLLDRVKESLLKEKIAFVALGGVKPNPRDDLVYEGIKICKSEGIDFILAVGGGSTIDSSKAIAAGTLYEGDFWDFYQGKPIEKALPVGTVLTIAAAGSEGSPSSVITKLSDNLKRGTSSDLIRPKFSLLNPALTMTLPPYQSASGIADIMAHLLERYLTKTKNVEVTDRLIEALLITMLMEGPKVIENPKDYEARANIMWAGMMAHNNSVGVGRTQDWASHAIEHELSAQYDVAHGAGLAVIFPEVLNYTMDQDLLRFARLGANVFGVPYDYETPKNTALEGVKRLRNFFNSLGLPSTLSELGVKEQDLDEMAHRACYGNGRLGFLGGFSNLGEEDVKNIYKNLL
ncbi:MAG TPA: iron-containing alcohol dehydrogenase [Candidatus Dorea intestinavium]|nr:iron-containing alcohol dehydrogenase [Candidatus Dorea intestinavium]